MRKPGTTPSNTPPAPTAARRSQRATPKIQRWMDLLAALLRRKFPAPFEELARDIPAYMAEGRSRESVMRMFERDKDELRDFGIPIRSELSSDGETHGYRLDRGEFYLPYLSVMAGESRSEPRRVDNEFYRSISTLAFTPDELAAIGQAAARVAELGEPRLHADAASALRKLSFDLPPDAVRTDDGVHVVHGERTVDPALFDILAEALHLRRVVVFDYNAMSSGTTERREVEGYGIFFLGGHWYLVGRDRNRGALRNFRLSRILAAERAPGAPGYDVPDGFSLREHARARSPWELGDGGVVDAIVELRRRTGATAAAARLGEPLDGADGAAEGDEWPLLRRYAVRRMDSFARWLLSFAGDAVPIEPPELVQELRRQARAALAIHAATGMNAATARHDHLPGATDGTAPRVADGTEEER